MNKIVLGFGLDLMFSSRVRETCDQAQIAYKGLKRAESIQTADTPQIVLVLINLETDPHELTSVVSKLRSFNPNLPIVGFFSHVNTEASQLAETLKVSEAMPKSQFVKVLPEMIASL